MLTGLLLVKPMVRSFWCSAFVFGFGCGGGDAPPPGGGGPVELRTTFTRSVASTNQLTFEGDAAIQDGDLVVAMLQARSLDDIELTTSPGWTLLAEDSAVMCTGLFHVWFLTATASASTTFEFGFDVPDAFSAVVTAYGGGSTATLLDFKLMGTLRNMPITYAATTLAPTSVVWVGGGAQASWTSFDAPIGMQQISAIDNLAAFHLPVADGNVPAIELPNDNGFCANVAQVAVEP